MNPSKIRSPKSAWQILLATMFCYLFFYTGRHNFGWATTGIIKELNVSFQAVGWISFSMLIGYALGQFINGNLADRFSPKLMIITGGLLSVAINIAISFLSSFQLILILWGANGFFQSMAWSSGSKLISNWWPPENRGKAYGFYTMAAGSSSVLTFLISILLVQEGAHWRSFFRYPVLLLFLAVIAFFIIADDKPEKQTISSKPTVKWQEEETWYNRYLMVFSNRNFLLASVGIGFQSMARYGLIFWVPTYFLGTHYKDTPGNLWLVLLLPVGMALGAMTFGQISDRILKGNRAHSIQLGMLTSALLAFLLYYLKTDSHIIIGILMLLIGFFVYGPQANFWSLVPDILGVRLVGTGTGVMNMFAYVFAAIGEPVLGFLIDYTEQPSNVFPAISFICIICVVTMLFVKTESLVKS